MTASDIESLQPRAGGGGRCLHACLITSVITLFVLLTGVAVTTALFIRQLQTELPKPPHEPTFEKRIQSEYKMQNFALLRPTSGHLKNETMKWKSVKETVGSGYEFLQYQHSLRPQADGSYLLYLDLVLRCCHSKPQGCGAIEVAMRVKRGDDHWDRSLLECRASASQRRAKCWDVVQLGSQQLLVVWMEVRGDTESWKLDTEHSGMGMFLVDGQTRWNVGGQTD